MEQEAIGEMCVYTSRGLIQSADWGGGKGEEYEEAAGPNPPLCNSKDTIISILFPKRQSSWKPVKTYNSHNSFSKQATQKKQSVPI